MAMIVVLFHLSVAPGSIFFFFNDTATTEIYTLSLHDVFRSMKRAEDLFYTKGVFFKCHHSGFYLGDVQYIIDRKSKRLNSSHTVISYAVFCLKKKQERCQSHEVSYIKFS